MYETMCTRCCPLEGQNALWPSDLVLGPLAASLPPRSTIVKRLTCTSVQQTKRKNWQRRRGSIFVPAPVECLDKKRTQAMLQKVTLSTVHYYRTGVL